MKIRLEKNIPVSFRIFIFCLFIKFQRTCLKRQRLNQPFCAFKPNQCGSQPFCAHVPPNIKRTLRTPWEVYKSKYCSKLHKIWNLRTSCDFLLTPCSTYVYAIRLQIQCTLDQPFKNPPQAHLLYHVSIKLLISATLFSLPTLLLEHFPFLIMLHSIC